MILSTLSPSFHHNLNSLPQTILTFQHGSTAHTTLRAFLPQPPSPDTPLPSPNKLHNPPIPHPNLRHPLRRPRFPLARSNLPRHSLPPLRPPPSPPMAKPSEDDLEHHASHLIFTHFRHSVGRYASKDERFTAIDDSCGDANRPRSVGGRSACASVGSEE